MIKLIIFDWGKVLGSGADPWNENLKIMQNKTDLTKLQLDKIFEKHWPKLKIGKEVLITFFREVSEKSNKKNSPQDLMKTYLENTVINKDVLSQTKNLKKKGYKMAILSNESKEKMNYQAAKFKLDTIFDKIYCSGQLGMSKPDKEIFQHVLNDQKLNPKEVLFIDDHEDVTESAKSLGINTILFKNPRQLKTELVSLLPY